MNRFVIGLVSFIAGAIAIFTFLKLEYNSTFGKDLDELRVVEAYMNPQHGFFKPELKGFLETVSINLKIRNFGGNTIVLTSASAEIENSEELFFATASQGDGVLGSNPEKNSVITIGPGETKGIRLSEGVKLKGITNFLESSEFKKEIFSNVGEKYLLHKQSWINRLNKALAFRYGKNATLSITLYEKFNKPIKKHKIKLSGGTNIFDNSGKFQHDLFLGAIRNLQAN